MRTCIDIGGTKTLIASVDDSGVIVKSEKFPTPQDYQQLVNQIADTLQKFDVNDTTIVVGAPGRMDRAKGVAVGFGNLPWKNVPLQNDLATATGKKVYLENDANLAALGEYYALPERPHQALYITVSTGIGSGVVTDGALDADHIDSELGEMLIEHNGQLIMFEKLASGSAIVRDYGKRAAELDDPNAWHNVCRVLAHGFINVLSMLKPDIIIIGGGVGTHFAKYEAILQEELRAIKPPLIDIPPIVQASKPEEAVILGCYELSKQLDTN